MTKNRIIRRQSIISKIQSWPFDFWLYVNEIKNSVEWDSFHFNIALPLGFALTILLLILTNILDYYSNINSKSKNLLFNSNYDQYEFLKDQMTSSRNKYSLHNNKNYQSNSFTNSILWGFQFLSISIIVLSLVNTYKILSSKRNYSLLYCEKKPNSKSVLRASIHKFPLIVEIIEFLLNMFYKNYDNEDSENESDENNDVTSENEEANDVWQLNIWNPSKFCLYLFIFLNPVSNYLIYCLNSSISLLNMIFLILFTSLVNFISINNFSTLINDKQILYQEMFKEYDFKFVKQKTNVLKKDSMIDATLGPYNSNILIDHEPYTFTKSKIFTTHDIKGKKITEYGDIKSQNLPKDLHSSRRSSVTTTGYSAVNSRSNSIYDFPSRSSSIYHNPYDKSHGFHNAYPDNNNSYMRSPSPNKYISRPTSPKKTPLISRSNNFSRTTITPQRWANIKTPLEVGISYHNSPSPTRSISPQHRTPMNNNITPFNTSLHHTPIPPPSSHSQSSFRSPSPIRRNNNLTNNYNKPWK